MEIEIKRTVMELRDLSNDARRGLSRRFNLAKVQRKNIVRQTRGGDNFASTLSLTVSETHDPDAVVAVAQTLNSILELPSAGTISWYMRAFIRRATTQEIIEYAGHIQTIGAAAPNGLQLADIKNRNLVLVELLRLRQLTSNLLPKGQTV